MELLEVAITIYFHNKLQAIDTDKEVSTFIKFLIYDASRNGFLKDEAHFRGDMDVTLLPEDRIYEV